MQNGSSNDGFVITGVNGFVGKHIFERLIRSGIKASIITSDKEKILSKYPDSPNLSVFSYSDPELFNRENFENKILIHCAWSSAHEPLSEVHLSEQLPFHINFLNSVVGLGLSQIICLGSCFEFGLSYGPHSPDRILKPNTPYSEAKVGVLKHMLALSQSGFRSANCSRLLFKWVRLFYTYGHAQHPMSIISQLDQAITSDATSFNMTFGEQLLDYLPVDTVIDKILEIANLPSDGIFHVSNGEPISLRRFVEQYISEKGLSGRILLNLGVIPYRETNSLAIWGNSKGIERVSWDLLDTKP